MTIHIRRATAADTAAIAAFNISMALETEGKHLDPTTITAGVANMIAHPERGFYLVAEDSATVVGSLMVTTEWSDWRNGLFWWIQSVFIIAPYRRQGIYSRLYATVQTLAAEADNVCGYRLYVEKDNRPAQLTYEHLGMQATDYLLYEALRPSTTTRSTPH